MAAFIPNYNSSLSISEQWRTHLQTQGYVNDVTSAIERSIEDYNRHAVELQGVIRETSAEISDTVVEAAVAQIETARENAAEIVGSIQHSADLISQTIDSVGRTIESIGQTLDHRLALLIDQQRVGNLLLHNVAELLRIPDFQKERLHYIQQGLKHYQNAVIDRSLMRDALANLLKAEERESSDYVVLHRVGLIYLYEFIDLPAAEDYFLRAGKYASVESEPAAVRVAFLLSEGTDFAGQYGDVNRVRNLAADAFLQAALASHLQQKALDAVRHAHRATELNPKYSLAWFNRAKFLAAANRTNEAVPMLEGLIRTERHYAASAAADADLAPKPEIFALLTRLRDEARITLEKEVKEVQGMNPPFLAKGGDKYEEYVRVTTNLQSNRYLNLRQGLDALPDIKGAAQVWSDTAKALSHFRAKLPAGAAVIEDAARYNRRLSTEKTYGTAIEVRSLLCKPHEQTPDVAGYLETLAAVTKAIAVARNDLAEINTLTAEFLEKLRKYQQMLKRSSTDDTIGAQTTLESTQRVVQQVIPMLGAAGGTLTNLSYQQCLTAKETSVRCADMKRQARENLSSKLPEVEAETRRLEQERRTQALMNWGPLIFIILFIAMAIWLIRLGYMG